MSEAVVDDMVAVLPPLLQTLESLSFVARNLNPPDFGRVMQIAGEPDEALQAVRPRLADWPEKFAHIKTALEAAIDAALAGYAGLRAVQNGEGDLVSVFRALRYLPRAQEALYPLTELPPVSGFFIAPELREDAELQATLAAAPNENTGMFHERNEPGSRGGFSMYVPEYYTPDRAWPLVMALHGGSGNGRGFLWSWLRDARSRGAILVAPTATGSTWALMGNDSDTPNLNRILDQVRERWRIDETRMVLTGMSDGGTFSYVTGLDGASRFTHLAPVAATFHPLMAEIADADRLRSLPIFITHGRLDWMFPVQTARQTQGLLSAAGARVIYRELDDLSHAYPREINGEILQWLNG
ncbi:phospholipase [Bradyrhizobium sp. ISRA443]|uniref:carboxylesterase family protein n=1 Tax=unclassified Bradyrhizobium TaxID=2631580 RepID=UPI00247A234F|nr:MULTISPECIES: phospholipase [unclassified Bradyrhizobium]WGS00329.1 phospholipase [Bradyrhizobium sp. ISRA436]WGS07218.1 phospholipase [Bradyrhizobium sp. ISRA437]WGS14103.1 phospholipase [Bradyrhizobium sp. ISRA443]